MDPTHARDVLSHLEKQNELLQETHNKMDHEMRKLQVEQEMLMRKLYQVMTTLDQTKKGEELLMLQPLVVMCKTESTSNGQ